MSVLPKSLEFDFEFDNTDIEEDEFDEYYEYAYDFMNNEFLLDDNGKQYYVTGNEAVKIWIYKTILTKRFVYSAYDDDFGTEIYDLIGEVISSQFKKEELKRLIIESIIIHPCITEIVSVEIETRKSVIEVEVEYKTKFDDEIEEVVCELRID